MKIVKLEIPENCYSIADSTNVKWLLWKHKWFVLGEDGYEELLTFQRNGTLIIYSNEKEMKGGWNYSHKTKFLSLRNTGTKINRMLHAFFWDGCLLVLKLNAVQEYIFLVNADKAYKLQKSPLDSFETYAYDAIKKQKLDKRRKITDENAQMPKDLHPLKPKAAKRPKIKPVEMAPVQDPMDILAKNPGPVSHTVRPPQPQEEPAQPVVPLAEVEERINQALKEQEKLLESKWLSKMDDMKDKLNGRIWILEKEEEERTQKALKKQERAFIMEMNRELKQQKQEIKQKEEDVWMRKIDKLNKEISKLKNKLRETNNDYSYLDWKIKSEKYLAEIERLKIEYKAKLMMVNKEKEDLLEKLASTQAELLSKTAHFDNLILSLSNTVNQMMENVNCDIKPQVENDCSAADETFYAPEMLSPAETQHPTRPDNLLHQKTELPQPENTFSVGETSLDAPEAFSPSETPVSTHRSFLSRLKQIFS